MIIQFNDVNDDTWNDCGGDELDEIECSAILARHATGRLAITEEGELDILPVRYVLDGKWIVVLVPSGLRVDKINLGHLALEVDEVDSDGERSVIVRGSASVITDGLDEASVRERRITLDQFGCTPNMRLIRIVPRIVQGARSVLGAV